jgi:hypothetical protein
LSGEDADSQTVVAGKQPFEKTTAIAGIIRDVGVIIGIPVLITVGMRLYDLQSKALEAQVRANEAQIKSLEAQNDLLKQTQYDRALSLLDGQRKVFQIDRDSLEKQIADLQKSGTPQAVGDVRRRLDDTNAALAALDRFYQNCQFVRPGTPGGRPNGVGRVECRDPKYPDTPPIVYNITGPPAMLPLPEALMRP